MRTKKLDLKKKLTGDKIYIASVSFGKDSLAMLLKLIENNYKIDEVIFYDNGMEFNAIYNLRDKIKNLLDEKNIQFTELKPRNPFLYDMFERTVNKRNGSIQYGYSWCGGICRWGTSEKIRTIENYLKKYDEYIEYVGIAIDETKRLEKERKRTKTFPLVDFNMSEKDCLEYCYQQGYNWNEDGIELYDILDRVSCWCCGNKNLKELYNYYKYLPKYWNKLKELQSKTDRKFKKNYDIFELETKFKNKGD